MKWIAIVTLTTFGLVDGDILAALQAHRGPNSLQLTLNDNKDSLTSSHLAEKFASDPNSWRNVADGVELIGWYTKPSKVSNATSAMEDALTKFYAVVGLDYVNKKKVRKGPVYTIKQGNVSKTFCIGESIGKGSYGEVRVAEDADTGELYALKTELESVDPKEKVIRAEFACYEDLSGNGLNAGIPFVVPNSTGVWQKRDVMLMELLGTNLDELFNICGKQFSMKTLLTVLIQLSGTLQQIHEKGYLHRDLKPENCMIGNIRGKNGAETSKFVKLVDFGFGTKYKDASGKFLPMEYEQAGTETYMSRDVFAKISPKPKDDIETLSYVMLYLWLGYMPFVVAEDKDQPEEELCKGCPAQLTEFLIDARRPMQETEMPDYTLHNNLLQDLFQKRGCVQDKKFDWERKLELLLLDPEVNKVGAAAQKVKTEDGTFWISVFLVGKFYVDLLPHMHELRKGLQKLHIDDNATTIARSVAQGWVEGSANPVIPDGNGIVITTKSIEIESLLKGFHAKYPTTLGKAGFAGMVLSPENFYVGFGCRYNKEKGIYTVAIVFIKQMVARGNGIYLKIDDTMMRLAHMYVTGKATQATAAGTKTKILEENIPLETVPMKQALAGSLNKFLGRLRELKVSESEIKVGYAYRVDTDKNKMVCALTFVQQKQSHEELPQKFRTAIQEFNLQIQSLQSVSMEHIFLDAISAA